MFVAGTSGAVLAAGEPGAVFSSPAQRALFLRLASRARCLPPANRALRFAASAILAAGEPGAMLAACEPGAVFVAGAPLSIFGRWRAGRDFCSRRAERDFLPPAPGFCSAAIAAASSKSTTCSGCSAPAGALGSGQRDAAFCFPPPVAFLRPDGRVPETSAPHSPAGACFASPSCAGWVATWLLRAGG